MLKIGHIALSVSNLDRSISFYEKNFGLRCVQRFQIGASGPEVGMLKKDDVNLELFQFDESVPLPSYRKDLNSDLKTLGVKHFAFEVADIEKTYEQLKNSNVKLVTDIRTLDNGLRYFFIKDHDGIFIELIEADLRGY